MIGLRDPARTGWGFASERIGAMIAGSLCAKFFLFVFAPPYLVEEEERAWLASACFLQILAAGVWEPFLPFRLGAPH